MIIKKFKKLPDTKVFLTNDSCNDPVVRLVAVCLITHVIQNPKNPCISYGDLSKLCQGKVHYRNLDAPLGEISELCRLNKLPLISVVVYNKTENRPGTGFFRYFFPQLPEKDWDEKFIDCTKQVMACKEWKNFIKIFE